MALHNPCKKKQAILGAFEARQQCYIPGEYNWFLFVFASCRFKCAHCGDFRRVLIARNAGLRARPYVESFTGRPLISSRKARQITRGASSLLLFIFFPRTGESASAPTTRPLAQTKKKRNKKEKEASAEQLVLAEKQRGTREARTTLIIRSA